MAFKGKPFVVVALLALLVAASVGLAQPAAPDAATTRPAVTVRSISSVLTVVPADAWGVVGVNSLAKLDVEVPKVISRLGIFFPLMPSGLVQMGLGAAEGFEPNGGVAAIFLDKMKYAEAREWTTFSNLPAPMVLAIAATDPKVLIESMGGKPAEQEGLYTATVAQEKVFAAARAGFVLLSPDAKLVKMVAGVGAPATRPAITALPASLTRQIGDANLFVLLNIKPITTSFDPIIRGMLATVAAISQAGQASAAGAPNMALMANAYYDILAKQVDKLVILGNLESQGLLLSGLVTFQPDTLLNKVFAAVKPSTQPLLSGLPDGQFILAAGSVSAGESLSRETAELFSKPMLDSLKASENAAVSAAASQQVRIMDLRVQLSQMQKSGRMGVYLQPDAENGLISVAAGAQFTDGPRAYDLIKQIATLQAESVKAQQPKAKAFLDSVVYTPDAETVGGTKVHVLMLDVTKLPAAMPEMSPKETEQAIKVIKALFGTDGITARIAVSDKQIVASLGGGTAALKKVLDMSKSGAAPLAKQEAIAKVQDRLPADRVAAFYLSAENLLSAVNQVAKTVGKPGTPFTPGDTTAPLVGMMVADPAGMHVALYVPMELVVHVKDMVGQAQQGDMSDSPGAESDEPAESGEEPGEPMEEPAAEPQAEPAPEF